MVQVNERAPRHLIERKQQQFARACGLLENLLWVAPALLFSAHSQEFHTLETQLEAAEMPQHPFSWQMPVNNSHQILLSCGLVSFCSLRISIIVLAGITKTQEI
jgi:hypothetical protein